MLRCDLTDAQQRIPGEIRHSAARALKNPKRHHQPLNPIPVKDSQDQSDKDLVYDA